MGYHYPLLFKLFFIFYKGYHYPLLFKLFFILFKKYHHPLLFLFFIFYSNKTTLLTSDSLVNSLPVLSAISCAKSRTS